jgi:hypothetical protein
VRSDPGPVLAAALPIPGLSAAKVARRAFRLMKGRGFDVRRTTATRFVWEDVPVMPLWFGARDGALFVANDEATLDAMERGGGPAWVRPEIAALSARYPLVLSSAVVPIRGSPPRRLDPPLSLAVTLETGIVRGVVTVPLTIEEIARLVREVEDARRAAKARLPGRAE